MLTLIERRVNAPIVRRLFASSPKDPRYHMLQHLSSRFNQNVEDMTHEPRAALFLNRFTRTLTVMYATNGIEEVIGISSEDMKGRSFYFCIAEECLQDSVQCLETAKANDSIAYLRFRYRDPRQDDEPPLEANESDLEADAEMTDVDAIESDGAVQSVGSSRPSGESGPSSANTNQPSGQPFASGGAAVDPTAEDELELEAVVSCTSDGLVVCLRRARPAVPTLMQNTPISAPGTAPRQYQGFFAAPWPAGPTPPQYLPRGPPTLASSQMIGMPAAWGGPSLTSESTPGGQYPLEFANAIRECAVFAWGLIGINGSLDSYARGRPSGDAQPQGGLDVWDANYKGE
jgi:hypothetical protein